MSPKIVEARHVEGFVIHIRFSDGSEGDVNFEGELNGEIFQPLRDPAFFKQFVLNSDFHVVTWPNGADIAPEFLYEKLQVPA